MGRRPRQTTFLRRHTDEKRYMKRCSTSLIIRETQIKAIMRYHLRPARMSIIKKIYKQQILERMWRKGNPLILFVGK